MHVRKEFVAIIMLVRITSRCDFAVDKNVIKRNTHPTFKGQAQKTMIT